MIKNDIHELSNNINLYVILSGKFANSILILIGGEFNKFIFVFILIIILFKLYYYIIVF